MGAPKSSFTGVRTRSRHPCINQTFTILPIKSKLHCPKIVRSLFHFNATGTILHCVQNLLIVVSSFVCVCGHKISFTEIFDLSRVKRFICTNLKWKLTDQQLPELEAILLVFTVKTCQLGFTQYFWFYLASEITI